VSLKNILCILLVTIAPVLNLRNIMYLFNCTTPWKKKNQNKKPTKKIKKSLAERIQLQPLLPNINNHREIGRSALLPSIVVLLLSSSQRAVAVCQVQEHAPFIGIHRQFTSSVLGVLRWSHLHPFSGFIFRPYRKPFAQADKRKEINEWKEKDNRTIP